MENDICQHPDDSLEFYSESESLFDRFKCIDCGYIFSLETED